MGICFQQKIIVTEYSLIYLFIYRIFGEILHKKKASEFVFFWGCVLFVGLAYQGNQGKKDIVFRFIIEYSSLRDFYRPLLGSNK